MPDLWRDFLRALVLPALTLLLLPVLTIGFTAIGERWIDAEILPQIEAHIDDDASVADKEATKAFYREHPPSWACSTSDPEAATYRDAVCAPWGDLWQFELASRAAWWMTALGLATFAGIGVLGALAFRSRAAQYVSFVIGWRALVAVTAVEIVVQGALAVWLSFWVTALFLHVYSVKLIGVVAILAVIAVGLALVQLFKSPPPRAPIAAEVVSEADAPGLWQRVRELAARVGTAPPTTILAGIDQNFFVTEAGIGLVRGDAITGRALYVSLPLLRQLSLDEADAVFAHELAHLHGGDTASSARLAPAMQRYDTYWQGLAAGGLTMPAAAVMRLYRAVFELALRRESREREFVADRTAVRLTSADAVARSLLKVVGYASFRSTTEQALFSANASHSGALELRSRIDAGLADHVAEPSFVAKVRETEVPHPYDSHPPIEERLAAAGASVRLDDVATLFAAPPERTWADEVTTGAAIEDRLWTAYEEAFRAQHDLSLACRYRPATPEERAHVERYFPERSWDGKAGRVIVTYAGFVLPDGARVAFSDVASAAVKDGRVYGSSLEVTLHAGRVVSVDLGALGAGAEPFKEAFGLYWQRDQVSRRQG